MFFLVVAKKRSGIINNKHQKLRRASLVQQQYEVRAKGRARIAMDALN